MFLLQPINAHLYITTVSLYAMHTLTCVLVWCTRQNSTLTTSTRDCICSCKYTLLAQ